MNQSVRSLQKQSRSGRRRAQRGRITEFGASLAILLPVAIFCLLVAVESVQIFLINSALNYSATQAARQLAVAYGQDPAGTMATPNTVLSQVKFLNIVQNSQQFTIPAGTAGWNTTSNPPTVTVNVSFKSAQYGCPVLPNPDPLGLSSQMVMTATATSHLE